MTKSKDEILKALSSDQPGIYFRSLHYHGSLGYILPDLLLGVGCTQNKYHGNSSVFEHSLNTLDAMALMSDDPYLRLAALLHDIGKPLVKSIDAEDNAHFYKHEVVGSKLAKEWMKSQEFPGDKTHYVKTLIRYHQFRFEDDSKDKTIRNLLWKTGKDTWFDLIVLRMADRKGNPSKEGLPLVTIEMEKFLARVNKLMSTGAPLFLEDLNITKRDIRWLRKKGLVADIMGIIYSNPKKNNKEWFRDYVNNTNNKNC